MVISVDSNFRDLQLSRRNLSRHFHDEIIAKVRIHIKRSISLVSVCTPEVVWVYLYDGLCVCLCVCACLSGYVIVPFI